MSVFLVGFRGIDRGFPCLDGASRAAVPVKEAKVEVGDGHAVHPDQLALDHGRLKAFEKESLR